MRHEFLVRGIEIFRLDLAIRELGRKGSQADEVGKARTEFSEHVRKIAQQQGKSLQELHLKTQILCVLMDADAPDLCQHLAKSIRDDVAFLCRTQARSGRLD
jgi:hypothetical protein